MRGCCHHVFVQTSTLTGSIRGGSGGGAADGGDEGGGAAQGQEVAAAAEEYLALYNIYRIGIFLKEEGGMFRDC